VTRRSVTSRLDQAGLLMEDLLSNTSRRGKQKAQAEITAPTSCTVEAQGRGQPTVCVAVQ
jgi:hypothetical protein